MKTLCIAAACALLAAPAAHAGSIIDSFIGGGGLSIGDCNADHCSFSMGKQKHVIRRSDFPSSANGVDVVDKLGAAAKSQLKARTKPGDVAERAAPSRSDHSDDRPAPRRDDTVVSTPKDTVAPAKDPGGAPARETQFAKDIVVTKDTVVTQDTAVKSSETTAVAPALAAVEAPAAYDPKSPIGEWVTEDGEGRVRIRACGQALCGVVSSGDPKETDRHNPDAGKRNRPLLGTPVLIDMKPTSNKRWEGEIYNAKNGKTYASNITLKNPDTLRVEGCVFGGFFCGGQDWVRAKDAPRG